MPNISKENSKDDKRVEIGSVGIESMLKKNLEWSEILHAQNKKILRRLTWMVVGSYLRLVLFLVPIIAAFIFLPPLLKTYVASLQDVLGVSNAGELKTENIKNLLEQFGK